MRTCISLLVLALPLMTTAQPFEHWLVPPEQVQREAAPFIKADPVQLPAHGSAPRMHHPFQTPASVPVALRGNREYILIADSTTLSLTVIKQDFNFVADDDPLLFTLVDEFDQAIATEEVSGDDDRSASSRTGPVLEKHFSIELPRPGLYRIRTTVNNDQRYHIQPDVEKWAVQSAIELFDASQRLQVYFIAPPSSFSINLFTRHFGGRFQSVIIRDSQGNRVDTVFVETIEQRYALQGDVPPQEVGQVWSLSMIAQDLILTADGLDYYSFSPEATFDFNAALNILQPRSLLRTTTVNSSVPFRFILENSAPGPVTIQPEVQSTSDQLTFEYPAAVTIDSSSTAYLDVRARIASTASEGQSIPFTFTFRDENNQALASARAVVQVTASRPAPRDRVFLDEQRLSLVRQRASQTGSDFAAIAQRVLRAADRFLNEQLTVLDARAGWTGRYISDGLGDGDDDPTDGDNASLIFDPTRPGVHISSSDGRRYTGERYDAAWRGHYQFELSNRLRTLGYAYALRNHEDDARYARDLLIAYAKRYTSWPLEGYLGNQTPIAARANVDTLSESIWLLNVLTGYAMTRTSSVYSEADRVHIEENLLRPAATVIRDNPMGISNWQAWHVTAVAITGYLLHDPELVDWAIHGPDGFTRLRDEAIRDDGLWFEGSVGYHFFALQPLHFLMQAAKTRGTMLYDERIRLAHTTVLNLLYPDGFFPNLNDQFNQSLTIRSAQYEFMNANDPDPRFDGVLTFLYENLSLPRRDFETLFYGEAYQPVQNFSPVPAVKEQMGLGILRTGNALADQVTLMDYGPHGESHGHLDKLHVSIFAEANAWLFDPGIGSRTVPEFLGWFQNTIGHNTILLNEQPQGQDTEDIRQIAFNRNSLPHLQVMQARFSAPIYPAHTTVQRTVIQLGNTTSVFLDSISAAGETIDTVFHSTGDEIRTEALFSTQSIPEHWETSATGYQFLAAPRIVNGSQAHGILQMQSNHPLAIETTHSYGFNDDAETLIGWSGNVGRSSIATEGHSSLQWIVVPRPTQSIRKSFHRLIPPDNPPTRLLLDYRVESNRFDELRVTLDRNQTTSTYRITSGEQAHPDEWQTADIPLDAPIATGTAPRVHQLAFSLIGATPENDFFHIWIDNIRLLDENGTLVPNENRGGALLFDSSSPTRYFLASGPSPSPPRRHTTVIARRSDQHRTQFATALVAINRNSSRQTPHGFQKTGQHTWRFYPDESTLTADPETHHYTWVDEQPSGQSLYAAIGADRLEGERMSWQFNETASVQVMTTRTETHIQVEYINPLQREGVFSLQVERVPDRVLIHGDEHPVESVLDVRPSGIWLKSDRLTAPDGTLEIRFDGATSVSNWILY